MLSEGGGQESTRDMSGTPSRHQPGRSAWTSALRRRCWRRRQRAARHRGGGTSGHGTQGPTFAACKMCCAALSSPAGERPHRTRLKPLLGSPGILAGVLDSLLAGWRAGGGGSRSGGGEAGGGGYAWASWLWVLEEYTIRGRDASVGGHGAPDFRWISTMPPSSSSAGGCGIRLGVSAWL